MSMYVWNSAATGFGRNEKRDKRCKHEDRLVSFRGDRTQFVRWTALMFAIWKTVSANIT